MRRLALLAVPLAVVLLSGCGQPGSGSSGSPSPSPDPTSTVSSSPSPSPTSTALGADVLLVITATATHPNGAVAHLVETVTGPFPASQLTSAQEAALDEECDGWRTAYASAGIVRGEFSATTVSGTWDGAPAGIDLGSWPVFAGDVQAMMSYCATDIMAIPGAATGASLFDAAAGADGSNGWADARYGFGIAIDPSLDAPGPDDVVLSDCAVVLGPAAAGSAIAAGWPGAPQLFNGAGCFVGQP